MKPILSAFLALAFVVTAFAATAGAEDWNVKNFWQQVDSEPQLSPDSTRINSTDR